MCVLGGLQDAEMQAEQEAALLKQEALQRRVTHPPPRAHARTRTRTRTHAHAHAAQPAPMR